MGCPWSKSFSSSRIAPKLDSTFTINPGPVTKEPINSSLASKRRRSEISIIDDTRPSSSHSQYDENISKKLLEQQSIVSIEETNDSRSESIKKSKADTTSSVSVEDITGNQSDHSENFDQPVIDEKVDEFQSNSDDDVKICNGDPNAFNSTFLQRRQAAIDNQSYQQQIDSCSPHTLQQLENFIRDLAKNKPVIDQFWIIFYWIARNIEYDAVSYFNDNIPSQTVEAVFKTKKSVCEGYSRLYKHLCDQIGLRCEKISGYAKGFGCDDEKKAALSRTNHAWNAVEIDDHWYLLDSTWGAGSLSHEKGFERKLNPFYFLAQPEHIIYTHLPEVDRWQLLREPIKKQQFIQMPRLKYNYFNLNVKLVDPQHPSLTLSNPNESYTVVLIRAPPTIDLSAELKWNGQEVEGGHQTLYDENEQLYTCYFAPSNTGKHDIHIFGREKSSKETSSNELVQFSLHVNKLPVKIVSFPKTHKIFHELGLEVVSPVETHLIQLNEDTRYACIKIRAPANVHLLGGLRTLNDDKIVGGHQVYFDHQKSLWICLFAPQADGLFDAIIFAKKSSDSGSYSSAVHFKIQATKVHQPPLSFPHTWQLFHDLGLEIESPKNTSTLPWQENASYGEVLIRSPDDIDLSSTLSYKDSKVSDGTLCQFDADRKLWQILFAPQNMCDHHLTVFAKKANESESECVVRFNLSVTALVAPMKFPKTYSVFSTRKCQIYEPLTGLLKKGSSVSIHCYIPGAADVKVVIDGTFTKYNAYKDPIFKTKLKADGVEKITLYAKTPDEKNYQGLFQYTITE